MGFIVVTCIFTCIIGLKRANPFNGEIRHLMWRIPFNWCVDSSLQRTSYCKGTTNFQNISHQRRYFCGNPQNKTATLGGSLNCCCMAWHHNESTADDGNAISNVII